MATATKSKKDKAPKDTEDQKRVFAKQKVKVKLTEKDRLKMAAEAAALHKELDTEKDLLAQRTKEFKGFKKPQDKKIKELSEKVATLLRSLDSGEAEQMEECGVVFDYKTNEVLTYFPKNSTKESDIVSRRTMDAKERQMSLIPEEAEAVAAGIPEEGMEATE